VSRPLYETKKDILAEARVAKRVAIKWNCKPIKLRPLYVIDYAMLRDGKCHAFVEIKCRSYSMKQMDDMNGFMLSLDKWRAGIDLSRASGAEFIIVVDTPDATWWHQVNPERPADHDGLSFGGRTDRDDPQDVEPVVLLRYGRFKKL
jgi:hypothetical protein